MFISLILPGYPQIVYFFHKFSLLSITTIMFMVLKSYPIQAVEVIKGKAITCYEMSEHCAVQRS